MDHNINQLGGSQTGLSEVNLLGIGNAQAQGLREASLRNKADETAGYLSHAHALLDQLQDVLHGPAPRAAGANAGMACDEPARHPGLRQVLAASSEGAAVIVGRLQTILASL